VDICIAYVMYVIQHQYGEDVAAPERVDSHLFLKKSSGTAMAERAIDVRPQPCRPFLSSLLRFFLSSLSRFKTTSDVEVRDVPIVTEQGLHQ
jgi:hypothetical protein